MKAPVGGRNGNPNCPHKNWITTHGYKVCEDCGMVLSKEDYERQLKGT